MDANEELPGTSRALESRKGGGEPYSFLAQYSSTPAVITSSVSNYQGDVAEGMDIRFQKANMKLPIKSLDNQSTGLPQSSGVSHQHVTLRNQHNYSSTTLISPIVPSSESRNHVQFTEPPREGRMNREDYNYNMSCGGNSAELSTSNSIFPYPEPAFPMERESGEILCQFLKILNFHMRIESEQQRLGVDGVKKRKDKPEVKVPPYDFQNDTFTDVNSEAANAALYLIFNAIDAPDAEQRFRYCWPVYEKKLEGVFRRVALDWIKDLVEENPIFFPGLLTEAIGGLLVNPGGERFISFLRHLCRLAVFTVADRKKDLIKEQILFPPIPSPDPEITNRQMRVLEFRARKNAEELRKRQKMLLRMETYLERTIEKVERNEKNINQHCNAASAKVADLMFKNPELFGNPTEEDIRERQNILSKFDLRSITDKKDDDGYDWDPFVRKMELALQKRVDEVCRSISFVNDVLEDFEDLWLIIERNQLEATELDWEKISASLQKRGSQEQSLNSFLKNFITTTQSLLTHEVLNQKTPDDLLQNFDEASRRIKIVEILHNEMSKNTHKKKLTSSRRQKLISKRNILDRRSDGFDWSRLSKISDGGTKDLFDVTPLLVYDVNRTSGRTPWINKFMDSSPSSSSGEFEVVGRRNPHIQKKTVRRNVQNTTDIRGTIVDSIDGKDLGEPSVADLSSKRIDSSTPLSSIPYQAVGIRGSSLFREFNISTNSTSASLRPTSSLRMKKSVSFDQTPNFTSSMVDSSSCSPVESANKRKCNRISPEAISFDYETSNILESPQVPHELLSGFSFNSSSSTPILDSSTKERLNKLMESVTSTRKSSFGISSISPIIRTSVESKDVSSNDNARPNDTQLVPKIEDCDRKRDDVSDGNIEAEDVEQTPYNNMAVNGLDCSSILEDFEGVKGIMETSFSVMDFLRHSDSDD